MGVKQINSRITGRNNFLFTVALAAIIGGLLFPQSTRIFDVLLVFSIFLTTAVLMITFSAKQILEVSSFPLLVVMATTLRIGLSVACAKFIFSGGDAGNIVNFSGNIFVRNNIMFSFLVFSILLIAIFAAICKGVRVIGRSVSEFTTDIVPVRQININSDLNSGLITEEQVLELRGKINNETSFFLAMSGAGRFMLCAAIIELIVIVANLFGGGAVGIIRETTTGVSVETYANSAIGSAMITQISALIIVTASGYLIQKSSVKNEMSEQESIKRIKIIANDVTSYSGDKSQSVREAELYKDKAGKINLPLLETNIDMRAKATAQTAEWFDGTAEPAEKDNSNLWNSELIKKSNCYGIIAELIKNKLKAKSKSVLIAAESSKYLPVTVPVNIAMRLSQKGQRCLLIDLDWQRDAISKVFEITSKDKGKAIETCISNLWIWPASNFGKNAMKIKEVIEDNESRYDHVIICAPNMDILTNREEIAGCVDAAMLFDSNGNNIEPVMSDFRELLNSYGCDIIEPGLIFKEIE